VKSEKFSHFPKKGKSIENFFFCGWFFYILFIYIAFDIKYNDLQYYIFTMAAISCLAWIPS